MSGGSPGPSAPQALDAPRLVVPELRSGLAEASTLAVGRADLAAHLGLAAQLGGTVRGDGFARIEAGYRPADPVTLFGYGQARYSPGAPVGLEAGVGARLTF